MCPAMHSVLVIARAKTRKSPVDRLYRQFNDKIIRKRTFNNVLFIYLLSLVGHGSTVSFGQMPFHLTAFFS